MEEELILKQPMDRRLGNVSALLPGPPGAEFDAAELDVAAPSKPVEKDLSGMRTSRRRSVSVSPPPQSRKRRSPSRGRRSPSSPPSVRDRRRSPPFSRRNRYRDYSPDRRRYDVGRLGQRSLESRRSPPSRNDRRGGGRDRYRGRLRSSSRSMSRSPSPVRRTGSRWSPKKKPNSPVQQPLMTMQSSLGQSQQPSSGVSNTQAQSTYGVLNHPGAQMYAADVYNATGAYNQYGVPPPQPNFVNNPDVYGMHRTTQNFNTSYPPPGSWGVDAYGQQQWLPTPSQMQAMPPPPPPQQQPQQPPPPVVGPPSTVTVVPPTISAVTSLQQSKNPMLMVLPSAPGGVEPNLPQHDAVAQEAENQRDELKKQRTSYMKKTAVLKKELKMLKEQRKDLQTNSAPPSPTTKGFIDENEKLQNQIQKKLSTIENVIDMLTGIIGEENLDHHHQNDYMDDMMPKESSSNAVIGGSGKSSSGHQVSEDAKQQKDRSVSPSLKFYKTNKSRSPSSSSDDTSSDTSSTTTSSGSSTTSENEIDVNSVGKGKVKNSTTGIGGRGGVSTASTEATTTGNTASANFAPYHRIDEGGDDDDDDSSAERLKNKVIESMKSKQKELAKCKQEQKSIEKRERFNYVFYDPEMHWCQTCDIFPKTARDYLNHLHSKEHMDRESIDTPWHLDMITDQFPTYENAPTKRTPIRGLTFFVPATAWFCKLCNIWMGDLHCASTHLKSQIHANRYNSFLEENPHYEVNWLADRQRVLNEKKSIPLPQQITSVSTTAAERKKSKKDEEKFSKKRKKKSDKKQKKKKKKSSSKKRKKTTRNSSSSSSSDSSSSTTDADEPKKKTRIAAIAPIEIRELNAPGPASSIKVTMRKEEQQQEELNNAKTCDTVSPSVRVKNDVTFQQSSSTQSNLENQSGENIGRLGKWTIAQDSSVQALSLTVLTSKFKDDEKRLQPDDDYNIIQQWNTVQPVISESEKKLLEQLKGKLKNKPKNEQQQNGQSVNQHSVVFSKDNLTSTLRSDMEKDNRERDRDKNRDRDKDRERDRGRDRDDKRITRRSRTRSRTRSRSRGRDYRRFRGRSRSRSRGGRRSPLRGWITRGRLRGAVGRSRSRSLHRRSRSYERRRQTSRSRTRTHSRSKSPVRIEKPIVKQPEFRPRIPGKEKEKEKKTQENKDKKDKAKAKTVPTSTSTSATTSAIMGKKLPFIGKMPVFKKQTISGIIESGEKRSDDQQQSNQQQHQQQQQGYVYPLGMESANTYTAATSIRPPAPTAAQIQMAMMEDAYGNAPPFHPDVGSMMIMDYDDLMPDPTQFVNIMGQAPPPPPPANIHEDEDMLPPGIDQEESEEFIAKPIMDGLVPNKGPLPKDLEEALNIIFPGDKKSEDNQKIDSDSNNVDEDDDQNCGRKSKNPISISSTGETQIIIEKPIMHVEELAKEGIHLVTLDGTSIAGMDEASQMSMNEPLIFNKPINHSNKSALSSNIMMKNIEIEKGKGQVNSLQQDDVFTLASVKDTAEQFVQFVAEPLQTVAMETKYENKVKHVDNQTSIYRNDYKIAITSKYSSESTSEKQVVNELHLVIDDRGEEKEKLSSNIALASLSSDGIPMPDLPIMHKEQSGGDEAKIIAHKATIPAIQQLASPFLNRKENVCEAVMTIINNNDIDLADIPQPPSSPTESEKNRRREELEDLAMLGIDADDMAAQCM